MSTINDIIKEALNAVGTIGVTHNIDSTPSEKNTNSNFSKNVPNLNTSDRHLNGGITRGIVNHKNEHAYKSGIGQSNIRK